MSAEPPHILLVEDNPADAELVAEALSEAALECGLSVVSDGLQAIAFIERLDADPCSRCPDLVLLDLNLPKVGGIEVLSRVRLSARCRAAKVLVISSSDTPTDRERSLKLGASEYFHKPSWNSAPKSERCWKTRIAPSDHRPYRRTIQYDRLPSDNLPRLRGL